MENAILIAKIAWVVYLAAWIWFLFNPLSLKALMDWFIKNTSLTFLTWMLTIIIWMLIINSYNVWEWNLEVIITIIWRIAVIKWISLLIMPKKLFKISWSVIKIWSSLVWFFAIILGLLTSYIGFFS